MLGKVDAVIYNFQDHKIQALKAYSTAVKGRNGFMFQRFESGKNVANFTNALYRIKDRIKHFFGGKVLSLEVQQRDGKSPEIGLTLGFSKRQSLEMTRAFDAKYREVYQRAKKGGADDCDAHDKASRVAANAAIARVVVEEQDQGRWTDIDTVDLLQRELVDLHPTNLKKNREIFKRQGHGTDESRVAMAERWALVTWKYERVFGNELTKLEYWQYKHAFCGELTNVLKDSNDLPSGNRLDAVSNSWANGGGGK